MDGAQQGEPTDGDNHETNDGDRNEITTTQKEISRFISRSKGHVCTKIQLDFFLYFKYLKGFFKSPHPGQDSNCIAFL